MLKGNISYRHEISGDRLLNLARLEFRPPDYPDVSKVELDSVGNRVLIVKVCFDSVSTLEDAKSVALVVAEITADKISVSLQVNVGGPGSPEVSFEEISSEESSAGKVINCFIEQGLSFSMRGSVTINPAPQEITSLKSLLNSAISSKDTWRSRYRGWPRLGVFALPGCRRHRRTGGATGFGGANLLSLCDTGSPRTANLCHPCERLQVQKSGARNPKQ